MFDLWLIRKFAKTLAKIFAEIFLIVDFFSGFRESICVHGNTVVFMKVFAQIILSRQFREERFKVGGDSRSSAET